MRRTLQRRTNGWLTVGVLALAMAATGCGLEDQLRYTFTVDQAVPEQVIPGDPAGAMFPLASLPPIAMDMQAEDEYQDQVENFGLVVAVTIRDLRFQITASSEDPALDGIEDGQPDDFSFLAWLEIYAEATVDGVLRRERVAYVEPGSPQLAPGGRALVTTCTGVDVGDILTNAGGYRLVVELTGTPPPDAVFVTGSVSVRVTVKTKW